MIRLFHKLYLVTITDYWHWFAGLLLPLSMKKSAYHFRKVGCGHEDFPSWKVDRRGEDSNWRLSFLKTTTWSASEAYRRKLHKCDFHGPFLDEKRALVLPSVPRNIYQHPQERIGGEQVSIISILNTFREHHTGIRMNDLDEHGRANLQVEYFDNCFHSNCLPNTEKNFLPAPERLLIDIRNENVCSYTALSKTIACTNPDKKDEDLWCAALKLNVIQLNPGMSTSTVYGVAPGESSMLGYRML